MPSIDNLRRAFLEEAHSAPNLFADLAKVETYIAESYKSRAVIEMLQNADDAHATRFGIHEVAGGFAIGNNGRPFTVEDVEALCRSGASGKKRGTGTIGYRGIGFKSVVGIARRIRVVSGAYAFEFDKGKTQRALRLESDVPLVRIPHTVENTSEGEQSDDAARLLEEHGYSTVFVFGDLNERLSHDELVQFDRGALLFLNHVRSVRFDAANVNRSIAIAVRALEPFRKHVLLKELSDKDEWQVTMSPRDAACMLAVRIASGTIRPAAKEESLFHAFTPTEEYAGALLKINGDFSTDPSRKHLDMDDRSVASLEEAVRLITDEVIELIQGGAVRPGFFSPFVPSASANGGVAKSPLLYSVSKLLLQRSISCENGLQESMDALRIRPDWLNYDDYELLCEKWRPYLTRALVTTYPELPEFLAMVGVPALSLAEILGVVSERHLSTVGYAQVVTRLLKQQRYDLTAERVAAFKRLRVFPVARDRVAAAPEVAGTSELMPHFWQWLVDNNETADLRLLMRKLGVPIDRDAEGALSTTKERALHPNSEVGEAGGTSGLALTPSTNAAGRRVMPEPTAPESHAFRQAPTLKQWRTAEENALEYLRCLRGVASVTDLSRANLGYDLEVRTDAGSRLYVEVKSVSSIGEPIRLTNNEYTSAHQHGMSYAVAVVLNGTPFQLMLVRDPLRHLELHKQCERWSWLCDDYADHLTPAEAICSVEAPG